MNSATNSPNAPAAQTPGLSSKILNLALDHLYQDRQETVSDLRQEFNREVNRTQVSPASVPREQAMEELESLLDHSRMLAGSLPSPTDLNRHVLSQPDREAAKEAAYLAVRKLLQLT